MEIKDKVYNIICNKDKGILKIFFREDLYLLVDLENKKFIELVYDYSIILKEVTRLDFKEVLNKIIKENRLIFDNKEYNIINYEIEV